jgi:hypothetical protein
MGYDTHFHGTLEFSRPMTATELAWIEQVLKAGQNWTPEISAAVWTKARRGRGAAIISGPDGSDLAAKMRGFITGKGLSAYYASALRVSDDGRGLVYCSEKTYDIVAGINFIITNTRTRIPDFGLKGMLAAETEFEPYEWFVKIGSDGMAYAEGTAPNSHIARSFRSFTDWLLLRQGKSPPARTGGPGRCVTLRMALRPFRLFPWVQCRRSGPKR